MEFSHCKIKIIGQCIHCNHNLREKDKHEQNEHPEFKYFHAVGKKGCFESEGFVRKNEIHMWCGCTRPELKIS